MVQIEWAVLDAEPVLDVTHMLVCWCRSLHSQISTSRFYTRSLLRSVAYSTAPLPSPVLASLISPPLSLFSERRPFSRHSRPPEFLPGLSLCYQLLLLPLDFLCLTAAQLIPVLITHYRQGTGKAGQRGPVMTSTQLGDASDIGYIFRGRRV